ncbi:cache domain-containing protein [Candidatus Woesearchaeota archaeon]|nr:cache domain-containing protein [Candidatus Woesearchaeota archaeon]
MVRIGINMKLVTLCVLLVAVPGIILGIVGYKAAEKAVYTGIEDRLQDISNDWRLLVTNQMNEIDMQEARVRNSAKNIVTAQAKMVYELIDEALDEQGGVLPKASKEDIFTRLNRNTVGASGYTWIIDYDGYYVLSKGRQRDGEYIWEEQDSDGNFVIQDLVGKGRELAQGEIGYHSYPWINKGETEPREKIASLLHFPTLKWVVGVSTYYDDLVDMGYRQRTIEHIKDMMAQQVIGRSGYIWVTDSAGVYQVSKNRLRDGEDISMSEDANGVLFIQEAVKKAKAAGSGTDVQRYPWQNKGETRPRMKVAGLSYVEELDWVIGPSAYYDDFAGEGALGNVRKILVTVAVIAIIAGTLLAFIFANRISSPLRKMTAAGKKIADGDLNAEIPAVKTKDEVEDLGTTMGMLVGALKFLKTNKEPPKKK